MATTFIPDTEPISKRDRVMLDRAVDLSRQSTVKQKHGAIIYRAGKVLAVGVNSTRNEHPTMEINSNAYTYHAELAAIRACGLPYLHNLQGATLYIARTNRSGKPMYSGPCERCMSHILKLNIKRVVFTS